MARIEIYDSALDAAARVRLDALEAIEVVGAGLATGGGALTGDRTITVSKASGAEAEAGTDDAKAVTPLALATPLNTIRADLGDVETGFAAHVADVANPHEVTATQVGLSNVADLAPADLPVSDATQIALNLKANLASPALTGTPTAPTAAPGTNTTQIATTAHVAAADAALTAAVALKAPLASPALTGAPTAPQAALGTDTAQIATTSFVAAAIEDAVGSGSALADHLADTDNPHEVTATQIGLGNVVDLAPADLPVSDATQIALNDLSDATDAVASDLATHLADAANPHEVTAAQVGLGSVNNTADSAKPVSTATQTALNTEATARALVATNLATHAALVNNPHSVTKAQVGLGSSDNTSDANKPVSTATQTAINSVQADIDADIADLAAHLADVANPHEVTAAQVGLGSVDDTADIDKPISDATQAALNDLSDDISVVAADLATHEALTDNPHGVTKAQVGLGSADNTSDVNKPVSTATQTALNTEATARALVATNLATHTANVSNPHTVTKAQVGLGNADNTSDVNKPVSAATQAAINAVQADVDADIADLATHLADVANPHEVTAAQVGLGDVDNTADADKPVSDATQTAINSVQADVDADIADLAAHLADVANPHEVTKAQVGLGSADNTSDVNKPVSTAAQTALNLKANIASPALTGTPTAPTAAPGTDTGQIATTAYAKAAADVVQSTLADHEALTNNPHSVTAAQLGLGSVDDTADADKPINDLTQAALDLKAPLASPALTGVPTAPTAAPGTNTPQIATTEFATAAIEIVNTATEAAQEDATQALADAAPVASLVSQSPERPGDAPALYGQSKTGDVDDVIPLEPGWAAISDYGSVVQVSGSVFPSPITIATSAAFPLEAGRVYEFRWKVQRQVDAADPLNDAVSIGIRWLVNNKGGVFGDGGTSIVEDIALLFTDGAQERTARVATTAGADIDYVAPTGAVYARPFVDVYGDSHVTDIIAIERRDITGQDTATTYNGVWDAETNTPPLASGVGERGDWWFVGTAGNTVLDDLSGWQVGDILAFNGLIWEKSSGSFESIEAELKEYVDAILSVDGGVGSFTIAYVTNIPDFVPLFLDGNGYSSDYYLDDVRISEPTVAVSEMKEAATPDGNVDPDYQWSNRTSDQVGLLGFHPSGYGVVGPLPAEDWIAYDFGAVGSRQVWIAAPGVSPVRISNPEDGTDCFSPSILSARLRYIGTDGATAASGVVCERILLGAVPDTLSASVTQITHIPALGQSNMQGAANAAVVSATPINSGRVIQFNGGLRANGNGHETVEGQTVTPPDNLQNLEDAVERVVGVSGESPMGQMGNTLATALGSTYTVLVSNHAIGATSYGDNKKGSVPYSNTMSAVRRARLIASINSFAYDVPALAWNQGEGNNTETAAAYRGHMEELQSDFTTDVNAITAVTKERFLTYVQMGDNCNYSVSPNVAQGQLDAAINNQTKILCCGPGYIYPTVVDGVHKTAQGQHDTGTTMGRYLARKLAASDALPLYMTGAVRTGASVVLTFHLPPDATTVAIDTSLVTDPGDRGVSWHQTGGTARTISSVSVTATNQITVTLSGDPGSPSSQQIGIGWLYTPGAASGPTTGGRSQIATDAATPDYACQQIITVT